MSKAKIFIIVIVLLIVGTVAMALTRNEGVGVGNVPNGKYDEFAQCLGDKGAVFYGAFWCPHCANQKRLFGSSAKLLPYVECSTPDGQGKTAQCLEKNIEGYPTWEFADGSRLSGEIPLATLAEKTACVLPL